MAFLVRPQVSWKYRKKVVVVYKNFNYYFFKDETADWIRNIFEGKKNNNVPSDFLKYLLDLNLVYEDN